AITAKATDNDLQVTTSTPVVTISVGNAAPLAVLTAPANAASYILGDAVTVSATATDADGTVASVAFFNGATSLGNGTVVLCTTR
ncbi:MAG: Ig-like domain-containing protein, partial [Atribacterota bacterium]